MIHLKIKSAQLNRARTLYDTDFKNSLKKNARSITRGGSCLYGAMGEILIGDYYKKYCEYDNTLNYDLIIKGKTVEVKSKRTTVEPQPYYFASIADPSRKQDSSKQQKCDYYCFMRVKADFTEAWILGWITPLEFFEKAIYYQKGEIDPSSKFNWKFKENCWNLPISELHLIDK